MRAMLSFASGGPETLRLTELPEPAPGPGEVAVAVRACGINFPDSLIIADRYQARPPRPFAPGGELSGTVAALGEGVTGLAVGDRVLGAPGWGGLAERVVLPAAGCRPMPDAMPFDEAACFLFTYGTSYHALVDRGGLEAGQTLLVLGAAGGVGVAAVEIGRALGARVLAAVSSDEKLAFARDCGAHDGIVYPAGPLDRDGAKALAAEFKHLCGADGADVVYDAVGGAYAEPALRAIAWGGRHLVVGFPAGIPSVPLNLPLLKSCQIVGVFWGGFVRSDPEGSARNERALFDFYGRGALRPRISARFPLERAGDAIAALADRRAMGKVVVTMGDAP